MLFLRSSFFHAKEKNTGLYAPLRFLLFHRCLPEVLRHFRLYRRRLRLQKPSPPNAPKELFQSYITVFAKLPKASPSFQSPRLNTARQTFTVCLRLYSLFYSFFSVPRFQKENARFTGYYRRSFSYRLNINRLITSGTGLILRISLQQDYSFYSL